MVEFSLFIQSLKDNTTHEVRKYIKDNDGIISIWTNSWYGRHVIGGDCQFLTCTEDSINRNIIRSFGFQLEEEGIKIATEVDIFEKYSLNTVTLFHSPNRTIIVDGPQANFVLFQGRIQSIIHLEIILKSIHVI